MLLLTRVVPRPGGRPPGLALRGVSGGRPHGLALPSGSDPSETAGQDPGAAAAVIPHCWPAATCRIRPSSYEREAAGSGEPGEVSWASSRRGSPAVALVARG